MKKYIIGFIIVLVVCLSSLTILNSMLFDSKKSFTRQEFTPEKVSRVLELFTRLASEGYKAQSPDEVKTFELSAEDINAIAAGVANRKQLAALFGLRLDDGLGGHDFCFSSEGGQIKVLVALKSGLSTPFGEMVNLSFKALPLVDEKTIALKVNSAGIGDFAMPAAMVEDFVNKEIDKHRQKEYYTIPRAIIRKVENRKNGNMIIHYSPFKLRTEFLSRIYRN